MMGSIATTSVNAIKSVEEQENAGPAGATENP
jgi:hypothetical protein